MPFMDGYTSAGNIKKLYPEIFIMGQTAYNTKENMEKGFKSGLDDFISKPVNKETIIKLINKIS